MGGFGGLVVRGLESAAEHSPVARDMAHAVVGEATNALNSMRANLSTSRGGRAIINLLETQHEPSFQKYQQEIGQQKLNYYQQGPNVQGAMQPAWQVPLEASNRARADTFSKNDAVLTYLIHQIEKQDGHEKAQYAVDALGTYFHEQARPDLKTGKSGAQALGTSSSTLVRNLAKDPLTKGTPYTLPEYKPRTTSERIASTMTAAALAPKTAVMHLSQQYNMALDQGVSSYLKGLMSIAPGIGDYEKGKFFLEHAGAAGVLATDELSALYARRYGGIASRLPKGVIGDFVAKNFSTPLMPAIKEFNMIVAGRQAMYKTAEIADTLKNGSNTQIRAAISDAKRLGLDWQKLQSGAPTKTDMETAMFHHINNTVFFNSPLNRSIYALNSPWGRSISMFHNFGLQQGNMIYNNLKRTLVEKHDPVSVVKFFAMMGLIAPAIGEGLEEFRQLATGRDWDHPIDHYTDRLGEFYSTKNFDEKLSAMSHIAGFSYILPYIRAAGRYKLAPALLGPTGGVGVELLQDVDKGFIQGDWDQTYRDILHDVPSMGLGAVASNLLLPRVSHRGSSRSSRATRATRASRPSR